MKHPNKGLAIIVLAVALCGLLSVQAQADGIIDFGMESLTSGVISYDGIGGPLVGTDIQVDNVIGIDTPFHAGIPSLEISGGLLNFATGNFDGAGTSPSSWNFLPGGEITLTGSINFPGSLGAIDATWLKGSFQGASVIEFGSSYKFAVAVFTDNKLCPIIGYYYGDTIPDDTTFLGGFNLSFIAEGVPPGAFTSTTLLSGDLTNTPVPVPASVLLLGSGLLGLVGVPRLRRRIKKS